MKLFRIEYSTEEVSSPLGKLRMPVIRSRLTKEEKKGLLHLLGSKHLSLLYKGSVHGERRELMNQIASYKPHLNSVPQFRVLFLGPVGAGKSSLFNSVKSVFRGYVTSQAIAGSDSTSVTAQYRTYDIKNEDNGKSLPIIFCDTMGLEEKQGAGLAIDEVPNLLQGYVPDRYQFNPCAAMQPNSLGCDKHPSLKDQIHCVVFVIDGSKVEILPDSLGEKLREIRRKINKFDMPQLVILTKVDEICSSLEENVSDVYRSRTVKKQVNTGNPSQYKFYEQAIL
ncbi:hypothetical protein JD844_017727 [Phrynosoma platyrhinos]|uniref:G domain-containing protein n=1 Tax=Phrynosoma platyrhinos TaxID=52577 RepID=A0ABQ7SMC9_PHRPL|nr:hypothetical protein JD844_017727 [Phrynosoma platyrhinos]